jgi:hypothetical protein
VNDAERLRHNPAMRWILGGKAAQARAASSSQMGRFETQWLAASANLSALANLSGNWIDRARKGQLNREIVLDVDSSVSPTNGEQEQSVWDGHFGCTCYHPLFVFNQVGDLERCALRPGNVHSADNWEAVLKPVVARYKGKASRIYFRGDATFAMPGIYDFLEFEGIDYAIRLPANQILQKEIAHLLKRPVGRPPRQVQRLYATFRYQAGSWAEPRRVVAKVEWHRVSSSHAPARLQLHALAYNLGNFMPTLATPVAIPDWTLTSLREKLIKIGAKVVSHGRYVTFRWPRWQSRATCSQNCSNGSPPYARRRRWR